MPLRREVITARMPELMGMGHKEETCQLARARHNLANRSRRQGRLAFGDEHIRRMGIGTLEFPQEASLRAAQWMFGVVPALRPLDIQIPGFEIHLVPSQCDEFGRAQPVAEHHEDDRRIAHGMTA
jgi:hypothetical protein